MAVTTAGMKPGTTRSFGERVFGTTARWARPRGPTLLERRFSLRDTSVAGLQAKG